MLGVLLKGGLVVLVLYTGEFSSELVALFLLFWYLIGIFSAKISSSKSGQGDIEKGHLS